jgi:TM2 domain-containing membrane protein YozV
MILLNKKLFSPVFLTKPVIIIFLLFSVYNAPALSQNLYDYEHSLKFASYLFETHQYKLAAEELERVVFIKPEDTAAKLKLIKSYRLSGNNEAAYNHLKTFNNIEKLPKEFSVEYIRIMLNSEDKQNCKSYLSSSKNLNTDDYNYFMLGTLILSNKWDEADHHIQKSNTSYSSYNSLINIYNEYKNSHFKNPFIAASMSAIIPGSGKFYTGRWRDGAVAFLFVSLNTWQAYRAFNKNGINSIYGWIFGTISLTFYSANIYGSYKSALNFNKKILNNLHEKTLLIINSDN